MTAKKPGKKEDADSGPSQAADIRQEAERRLGNKKATPVEGMAEVDARGLLHELQVNQIELEMQNEELLRAQAALRESEQRFRDLAELLPQTVFEVDLEGRLTFLNRRALETLGYTQAEFEAGLSCFQMLASHEHDRARHNIQRVLSGQDLGGTEYTAQRKDGTQYPVAVYSSPILRDQVPAGLRGIIVDVTDRKQAEESLREGKAYTQSIIRSMADMLVVISPDGTIATVNEATCQSLGYLEEDLIGRPATLLFQEEEDSVEFVLSQLPLPVKRTVLRRLVKQGSVRNIEKSLRTKDGVRVPVLLSGSVMRGDEGEIRGIVCVASDITERKRAEQELRLSRQRLALHVQQTPLAVIEFDLDGRVREWNPAAVATFGFSREEALGQHWTFIVPEAIWGSLEGVWDAIVNHRGGSRSTNENRTKDGRIIACEWFNTALVDPQGISIGAASLVMDVTQRRQAEAALRESEARYRDLVETTHDLVWAVDMDGRITFISQAAEEVYGRHPKEILGRPFLEFIAPEEHEQVRAAFQAAVATGQAARDTERHVLHANGTRRLLAAKSIALRDHQGRVIGFFGTSQDITERRQTEEAMRRLERMQAEAEKLAATGRMAARVAHEINNPLAGIKNAFRLIKDAVPEDHPDRDMAERIDREIARISNIVQQMYTLYSPQAGQITEVVVDAVRDVLSMLEPLRREAEVRFDAAHVLPGLSVLVPDGGLHQILYNLTANAIEASPRGGVITIAAELANGRPDLVRISVHDRGKGISPDIRPRIFEPFFTSRADDHSRQGLGLGLSVVKSVVVASGGAIEFDSAPELGTTFRVFLPNCAYPEFWRIRLRAHCAAPIPE